MKINFIVPEISITGGIRAVFKIANLLTQKKHDVIVYAPGIPANPYKGQIKPYYIRYRYKKMFKYFSGKLKIPDDVFKYDFKIKIVPFVNSFFIRNSDAVIATAWTTARPVYLLSRSKGKKFYFIQDYEVWNSNVKYVDESYRFPLKAITISDYLVKLLKEKFNKDSSKVLMSPDYDIFYNDKKIFNDPPAILFMDHMLENKNTAGAIRTAVKLKEKYPELKVRAFGVYKHREFPDFVEFSSGNTDEQVRKLYSMSDIFIFPSLYEGFGIPPAEAMACKCAVVGNAVGALHEYAVDGETALLTDPKDPEALFKSVCKLIDNRELLKKISIAGYEYVRKKLDWENSVDEFEKILISE